MLAGVLASLFLAAPTPLQAVAPWKEITRVAPDGLAEGDRLTFVALSGERLILGAPFGSGSAVGSGAAYVYERSPEGDWNLAAKLAGSQISAGSFFGSCDIEKNLAVVGAFGDDDLGISTGAVYVFERVRGEWLERARLLAEDAHAGQGFGGRVALSDERILVSAASDDSGGIRSGASYVFERAANGRWVQTAKLAAVDPQPGELFGTGLALDGERALIGTSGTLTLAPRAFVFERAPDGHWIQRAVLSAPPSSRNFGSSMDLKGGRALIGALNDDSVGHASGAAYLYERRLHGSWGLETRLTAADAVGGEQLGGWVALSGNRALAGAGRANAPGFESGAAYLFERDANGLWQEVETLTASDGAARSRFGSCVALEGNRAVISAPFADGSFLDTGSVYVFERAPQLPRVRR